MKYGQFCPIAKASELLGDKWTFLILRELLVGGCRFSEIQNGLKLISPSLLTKRLRELEKEGIVTRHKIKEQRGYEYHLTKAGREVMPIIQELGKWGMKWARELIEDDELDVELLMLYLGRSIAPENLPTKETIIYFKFTDLSKLKEWWIIVKNNDIDVCLSDPGKEINIWFTTNLRTMMEVWMGDSSYKTAIKENKLNIIGPRSLTGNVTKWMRNSDFSKPK